MKLRDLGTLTGAVLLFGGPYSNAQALQALERRAGRLGISGTALVCTGDVVGYGADPMACIGQVRAMGAVVIAGNVERKLASGAPDCGCGFAPGSACDLLSDGWYRYAGRQVDSDTRDWMENLPDMAVFAHEGRRFAVVHGGLTDIARFLWPSSPDHAFRQEITAIEAVAGPVDGVVAGHCGLAFERVVGGVHWINAGVIGLPPHDGRSLTRYAVLTGDGVRFHRLDYDVGAAQAAMRAAGLTQGYDTALTSGFWPSQDVLPEAMRQ